VEMLGEALDGAALAGGVPALEDDDRLLIVVLEPVLVLQQLDLQLVLLALVLVAVHAGLVGVPLLPGVDGVALGIDEVRIRGVAVQDRVPLLAQMLDVLAQALVVRDLHGRCFARWGMGPTVKAPHGVPVNCRSRPGRSVRPAAGSGDGGMPTIRSARPLGGSLSGRSGASR